MYAVPIFLKKYALKYIIAKQVPEEDHFGSVGDSTIVGSDPAIQMRL